MREIVSEVELEEKSASNPRRFSVAILNRFYPPDRSPTGEAARILAQKLIERGFNVHIVTTDAGYVHGAQGPHPDVDSRLRVSRLRSLYKGRARLPRFANGLFDGYRMSKFAIRDSDLVIALTDPPLLPLWVSADACRYRVPWVEWSMDLFPEAFVAAGLVKSRNPFVRWLERQVRRRPPNFRICLGDAQRHFMDNHRGEAPAVVWPYGVVRASDTEELFDAASPVKLIYAGNFGEAHDEKFLVQLVAAADPVRFIFLLALQGVKAASLRQQFAGISHVRLYDRISDSLFATAAAHIVSLRANWTHVCVPSKAIGAVSAGKPILFAGSPQSDNAALLGDAAWIVPEYDGGTYRKTDILQALEAIADPDERRQKTAAARLLGQRLRDDEPLAIAAIIDRIEALLTPGAGQQNVR